MAALYAPAIRIQRVTLAAGVLTPITPPAPFTHCMVGNITGSDLSIYTCDDVAQNEFRVVTTGFERELRAYHRGFYQNLGAAFWLLSTPGGTVILEWS